MAQAEVNMTQSASDAYLPLPLRGRKTLLLSLVQLQLVIYKIFEKLLLLHSY